YARAHIYRPLRCCSRVFAWLLVRSISARTSASYAHFLSDERQPAPVLRHLASNGLVEYVLNAAGDRARLAVADHAAVDVANGRDLHGGAGEEQLVGAQD